MKDLTLQQLTELVMEQAKRKGFGTTPDEINVGEKIALIHSEISEAYDAYRKQRTGKGSFEEELGDAVQRILHLGGVMGVDLGAAIVAKLDVNKDRDWDWDPLTKPKRK